MTGIPVNRYAMFFMCSLFSVTLGQLFHYYVYECTCILPGKATLEMTYTV